MKIINKYRPIYQFGQTVVIFYICMTNSKVFLLRYISLHFLAVSNSGKTFSLADGFSLDSDEGQRILKAKSKHFGEVRQVCMILHFLNDLCFDFFISDTVI